MPASSPSGAVFLGRAGRAERKARRGPDPALAKPGQRRGGPTRRRGTRATRSSASSEHGEDPPFRGDRRPAQTARDRGGDAGVDAITTQGVEDELLGATLRASPVVGCEDQATPVEYSPLARVDVTADRTVYRFVHVEDMGDERLPEAAAWGGYPAGRAVERAAPLFPRRKA